MLQPRHLAVAIAAVTTCLAAAPGDGPPRTAALTCTNPASGTTWQISIDYDRATVDANPASVSDTQISWRDARDGWNYKLDRRTGDLTVIFASSMGGSFLFDRCQLPP